MFPLLFWLKFSWPRRFYSTAQLHYSSREYSKDHYSMAQLQKIFQVLLLGAVCASKALGESHGNSCAHDLELDLCEGEPTLVEVTEGEPTLGEVTAMPPTPPTPPYEGTTQAQPLMPYLTCLYISNSHRVRRSCVFLNMNLYIYIHIYIYYLYLFICVCMRVLETIIVCRNVSTTNFLKRRQLYFSDILAVIISRNVSK